MRDDVLNRLKVKRGSQLPWAKLDENRVSEIRRIIDRREAMRRELSQLSNKRIAEKYGVHYRTIDRISAGEAWTHV